MICSAIVGIIILKKFPIDFNIKTKNVLFSVTLLLKFTKKNDCQNRLVFTKNFYHNTEFIQQSTKGRNKISPKPIFVFPTAVHVAHVNIQHWPTFNMTYLPSNILHFQGNGTVSNIELYFIRSHIFCSGPSGVPIFSKHDTFRIVNVCPKVILLCFLLQNYYSLCNWLLVGCIEGLRRFSGISAISRLGSRR